MSGRLVTATVHKEDREVKTGVSLKQKDGSVVVSEISDNSPFKSSILKVGFEIITINNVPTEGKTVAQVAELIREASGDVTILARERWPSLVTATVRKETKDTKTGISLASEPDGKIVISGVDDTGLFSGLLPVGYEVLAINNISTKDKTKKEVADVVRAAQGTVTIVAQERTFSVLATPVPATAPVEPVEPVAPVHFSTASVGASIAVQPPPGVPSGGVWGKQSYIGEKTSAAACVGFLCFCLPGLFLLCCPLDERDAYKVRGIVYTADGKRVDPDRFKAYGPHRQSMAR